MYMREAELQARVAAGEVERWASDIAEAVRKVQESEVALRNAWRRTIDSIWAAESANEVQVPRAVQL